MFKKGQSGNKNGRPKGSTTRPQIRDYFTRQEIIKLVQDAKTKAENGDTHLMKFLLEQIFGKAIQPLGNEDGKALIIKFDGSFTSQTTGDSKK